MGGSSVWEEFLRLNFGCVGLGCVIICWVLCQTAVCQSERTCRHWLDVSMSRYKYSPWNFAFTCLSLLMFLLDIVLDVLVAVSFYQHEAYVCLGILILVLLGSSILAQAYSLLWYSYDDFKMETRAERCLSKSQLILLHVFQLGLYIRQAGVFETSIESLRRRSREGAAVNLSQDLSMLRIIETFSESAPQFVLMFTIILQEGRQDVVTVLKAIGSVSSIAFSVTKYQLSMRSFLPEKEKKPLTSFVVFFLWNLLLLSPRLTALALFASVFPCFIFTHFFCSWLVLLFFAWRSKTDFMDSACGEWLYQATVALIWYFNWFDLVEGRTRNRTVLYHSYVLADICLLCGVWCWKMSMDPPHVVIPPSYAIITTVSVAAVYVFGLFIRMVYYKLYHTNVGKDELKGGTDNIMFKASVFSGSEDNVHDPVAVPEPPQPSVHCSKRMRKLAENFYT